MTKMRIDDVVITVIRLIDRLFDRLEDLEKRVSKLEEEKEASDE